MRAVIVIPAGSKEDVDGWTQDCLSYCEAEGFPVAALLVGHGWRAAYEMVSTGLAEVIVVDRESHLDPFRVPQLRVVEVEREKKTQRRRGLRRPRIMNR